METNIVAVERISEYAQLKTEAQWRRTVNEQPKLEPDWPKTGEVKFEDYSVRYREGLDLVLSGVDFSVKAGAKIGCVGRTGAGDVLMLMFIDFKLNFIVFRQIKPDTGPLSHSRASWWTNPH